MRRVTSLVWSWIQRVLEQVDQLILDFLRTRATLIAALIGTLLLVWGIAHSDPEMGLAAVLAGATGYLLGFAPAVAGGLLITIVQWLESGAKVSNLPVLLIEVLGYTYIAWLGRQHKQAAKARRSRLADVQHDPKVVPWSFVNEVRNSLLAMRLLLFVKQDEAVTLSQLRMVEDELLRLESLFGNLQDK